eukprot:229942-Pleurochrysis_carterae.AAC.1
MAIAPRRFARRERCSCPRPTGRTPRSRLRRRRVRAPLPPPPSTAANAAATATVAASAAHTWPRQPAALSWVAQASPTVDDLMLYFVADCEAHNSPSKVCGCEEGSSLVAHSRHSTCQTSRLWAPSFLTLRALDHFVSITPSASTFSPSTASFNVLVGVRCLQAVLEALDEMEMESSQALAYFYKRVVQIGGERREKLNAELKGMQMGILASMVCVPIAVRARGLLKSGC